MTAERAVTREPGASSPATRAASVAPAVAPSPYRALGNRAVGRLLAAEGGHSASRALEPGLRTTMEARFGQDFESVRIYTGPAARSLAGAHRAKALTIGDDIVFRDGYPPSADAGRQSLAHELAHVVQQRRGGPQAGEPALESDAERAARAFVAHPTGPVVVHEASGARVSRQADESGEPDDSLGWIDHVISAVVQAATGGLGGPMPSLVAVAVRGFLAEMKHQLSWTSLVKLEAELRHLEIGNFVAGYAAGAIAGLASPLTDLVGLVAMVGHIPGAVAKVLVKGYQEREAILAEAEAIAERIRNWLSNLGKEIGGLDANTIQQLLDILGKRATKAASSAGHQAARELIATLTGGGDAAKESWVSELFVGNKSRERGYNIGHTVGAVVSNALIFVFTEGVGDAIVQIGARLGKLGGLVGKSAELVVAIGEVVAGVERAIGAVVGTVLKPLEKLLKPLVEVLERLKSLLRRLLGAVEKGPVAAAAEAGAEALEKKLAPKPAAPAPGPKPAASRPAPKPAAPQPAPARKIQVEAEPWPDVEDLAPGSVAPSPSPSPSPAQRGGGRRRVRVSTEPPADVEELAPESVLPPPEPAEKVRVGTEPEPAQKVRVGTEPEPAEKVRVGTEPEPAEKVRVSTEPPAEVEDLAPELVAEPAPQRQAAVPPRAEPVPAPAQSVPPETTGGSPETAGKLPDKPGEAPSPKAADSAGQPETAPKVPKGMSLHEMGEPASKAKYYPDAFEPVAKQPGVDWADHPRAVDQREWVDPKTGANRVEQKIDGGTWIQSKRLKDGVTGSVDQRVINNIDDAMRKLEKPMRTSTSSRSITRADGTKVRTTLTNPEGFLVHLEVPGFSQLDKAGQVRLQAIADQNLGLWKDHYPDLPLKVVVVDVP